jgi:uncharacterized protein YneF (UPF0154 family)
MKRISVLLVIIGIMIGIAIGFWFCDKNSIKVYRVHEWTQEEK